MNPHDVEAIADSIYQAVTMTPEDKRARMRRLRRTIRDTDIFWWVDSYLRAAIEKDLSHFPLAEESTLDVESILTQ